MKKLIKYFGVVVAAAAILSGCSKALDNKEVEENVSRITCTLPDDGTKTYADGLKVKWVLGDNLFVTTMSDHKTKTFTCTKIDDSGTIAEFEGPAIAKGDEIVAAHFCQYSIGWLSYNKWYYDVPQSIEDKNLNNWNLNDCISGSGNIHNPMVSYQITVSDPDNIKVSLHHTESLVRLTLNNKKGEDLVIKSVSFESDGSEAYGGRRSLKSDYSGSDHYSYTQGMVYGYSGDVLIANGESTTLDFVVIAKNYAALCVKVATNSGQYVFTKANFTANIGVIHNFNVDLTEPQEDHSYKFIINGQADKPLYWGISKPIPSIPDVVTNSIAIIPGDKSDIGALELKAIKDGLSSVKDRTISIDLRGIDYTSASYGTSAFKGLGCLGDFYFPKNVTSTSGYSLFDGDVNAKLHISKDMTGNIDYILWGYQSSASSALKAGCGIFVDAENPKYYSEDGVLYQKNGDNKYYTLWQKPMFEGEGIYEINSNVQALNSYAISNNCLITTVIFPANLLSIKGSFGAYASKISKLVFRGTTPPSFATDFMPGANFGAKTGIIEIDTGTDAGDDAAILLYYASLNGKLGAGWSLRTKSGKEINSKGELTPLTKGTPYLNIW